MPTDWPFEPPDPAILPYIIRGNTANLRWADAMSPAQLNMNAGKDRIYCDYDARWTTPAAAE